MNDLISRAAAIEAVTIADRNCLGAHGAREAIHALPAASQPEAEPVAWLPTATVRWLLEYDGPACATTTVAHNRPLKSDGGVPVYLHPATPAPVVSAEGPISTLEMVYRNMPDIPELPEAYQPRNIARSLAALRSAPPVGARVTGWQPIETAPKDGVTEVLMYDPDLGMAVWPSTNSPWPNVTHWMPLPEPPAALLPAGEGE